jgi:hypothetical protein
MTKQVGMIAFEMDRKATPASVADAVAVAGEHIPGFKLLTSLKMSDSEFETRVMKEIKKD